MTKRRFTRLSAMLAASLWVLAGLLVAQAFDLLPKMPQGYAVTGWTIAGGALLGLGAFVGRACVFGAIARFGNGEWSYLLVPVGFYVGCVSVAPLFMPAMPAKLAQGSAVLDRAAGVAVLLAIVVVAWLARTWSAPAAPTSSSRFGFAARVWSPGTATAVIGITFFFMMMLVGPWAYTEALADVARKMSHDLLSRGVLMFALFAGAFVGGLTARRFGSTSVTLARLARCFASGVLMGWGSLLIPGGNDGLILVGMPLLFPYAWLAMVSMALAIGVAMVVSRSSAPAPRDVRQASEEAGAN